MYGFLKFNLVLGVIAHAVLSLSLMAEYLSGVEEDEVFSLVAIAVTAVGALVCLACWRKLSGQGDWETSGSFKWFCFFVTPWGLFLGAGVGVIIAAFVAMGAYAGSEGGGSSGGGASGGKVKRDNLGKYPYNSWEAQREREAELVLHSAIQTQNRQRMAMQDATKRDWMARNSDGQEWTWGSTRSGAKIDSTTYDEASADPPASVWRDPTKPLFGKPPRRRSD